MRFSAIFLLAIMTCAWPKALAQPSNLLPPQAKQRTVSFVDDIHPILAERCFKCHSDDKRKGGLYMSGRDALIEGGETGPSVVVGNSADSYLIRLVSGQIEDTPMPSKGDPLSADQIAVLRAWIDQGLEWDLEVGENDGWLAPIEPRRPPVPDIVGLDNPIDRILSTYLDEHDIKLSKPVDDRVFARRAYLDLIGLLPTEEELNQFLEENDDEKRARLVRRLLDNRRQYAEHWMTPWNDALRNDFQGTGYIDGGRKQLTNWLYNALYENIPYDRFVTALINPTSANEGFINGIVWRGVTAANQQIPLQAARNVSQVFLGVNLKCASCHDSFVDDWKLADSYGLAAMFSDEPLELVRCDLPTGKTAVGKFLWPELGNVDMSRSRKGRLPQIARLVTKEENGRFTRTIVNRLWAKMMGRGLVEPLDNMESRPWNVDVLDWLATDLADHGYDLKRTLSVIATSRAYQMPGVHAAPEEDFVFRGPTPKRLSPEQLLDGIGRVTGAWQEGSKFAVPETSEEIQPVRAWRSSATPLTRALGRPAREQVNTHRVNEATTLQALELTNGDELNAYINRGAEILATELNGQSVAEVVNKVYARALQRAPSAGEKKASSNLLGDEWDAHNLADLLWAVVMLPEFQVVY
jgi:hypothetical protein